jgi:hypothetical protein
MTILAARSASQVGDPGQWVRVDPIHPLPKRDFRGAVVHDSKMWVLGGIARVAERLVVYNDVWSSSDGRRWIEVTDSAEWPIRFSLSVVSFKGELWVIGGTLGGVVTYGDEVNDIWRSADGVNWTLVTDAAPWALRDGYAVTVHDNRIWVIGGLLTGGGALQNDVWWTDDGVDWTQATAATPWAPRSSHYAFSFDDRLWIMGGFWANNIPPTNVWSSADGVLWDRVASTSPVHVTLAASAAFNGEMWILSGTSQHHPMLSPLARRSANGVDWMTEELPWTPRVGHSSVVFDNKLWMLGWGDDVWFFTPRSRADYWILYDRQVEPPKSGSHAIANRENY